MSRNEIEPDDPLQPPPTGMEGTMTTPSTTPPASPDAPTAPPAHPARKDHPAHTAHLDSPWRTMLGLLILWGSLGLIFWANRLDTFISHVDGANSATPAQMLVFDQAVDFLLRPCEVNMPNTSPRDALAQMADKLNLQLDKESLDKLLSKASGTFNYTGLPLYKVIHRLIDNRDVGYAIEGRRLLLFAQKQTAPAAEHKQFTWETEIELSGKPISIFPSGDSDVWFTIQMIRDLSAGNDPWRTVQIDFWKGAEKQTISRLMLDGSGKAILSMSARENISFQIERKAPPQSGAAPGRYHMIFSFQAFE